MLPLVDCNFPETGFEEVGRISTRETGMAYAISCQWFQSLRSALITANRTQSIFLTDRSYALSLLELTVVFRLFKSGLRVRMSVPPPYSL
jgi:hypothetical protein